MDRSVRRRQRRKQSAASQALPAVERLNRAREAIMRGRQLDDSTEILRQLREERARWAEQVGGAGE